MKSTFFAFLFCLFFLSIGITNAQNEQKKDSLLALIKQSKSDTIKASNYLELGNLTLYNNPKEAKVYIENSLLLYKKANYKKGLAKAYSKKATYFYIESYKDSARYYLDKSIATYLRIGDSSKAAFIRHNLGIMYLDEGNYKKCLDIMDENIPIFKRLNDSVALGNAYLMKGKVAFIRGFHTIALNETYKALKIHENTKESVRIAEDLLQIGTIHNDLEDYKKAIAAFKQSYALYDSLDYSQPKSQALNYIGYSYLTLNDFDAARKAFLKALQLSQEVDYKTNIARIYVNMGSLEYKLGNYTLAMENFKKGAALWKPLSNLDNEADVLFKIGKTYAIKEEYTKAIDYFNQSIKITSTINSQKLLKETYENRAIAFEKLGDYKTAYSDYKKSTIINDSLHVIKISKSIEELNILYDTEKKQQQIAAQKSTIKLLDQESKIKKLQQIILVIWIILLVLLFGLIFIEIRKKLRQSLVEKTALDLALHNTKKELTVKTLYIAKKNTVLENLKQEVTHINHKEDPQTQQNLRKLIQTINFDVKDDQNWENFSKYFEETHQDFYKEIKNRFPTITAKELKLIALLKLNLSSKEIGTLLNISQDGVKKARYRLRKKMNLTAEESLQDFIVNI